MTELELSKSILKKVVENDYPFALILKNTFKKQKVEPYQKANVTALVGCELRHHYIFDNLIARYIGEVEFEKTIYLRFALANRKFLKRFNDQELVKLAYQDLGQEKVDALISFVDSTDQIIPEELDKTSPEFLSLRFNTPAWVIRMWQKQYGKGVVFKVLKVNYRPSAASIRVNERNIDVSEFLAKHPDFAAAPIDNMIVYQGRGTPKSIKEFESNDLFFEKMATKYILDQLDLDPIKGIAIFSEVPNNIYLDLVTRFGKEVKADLIINHTASFFETRKVIESQGYSHIFACEGEVGSLITCLSHKVHTLLCMPKSTLFDLLRSTPDYFLRIKQDKLDEIIVHQQECLEECSKYVEEGGELVYMIPTLSRKESNNVIANFLVKHPEYKLIEERQFFPFEVYDSCLYSARLMKAEETSD